MPDFGWSGGSYATQQDITNAIAALPTPIALSDMTPAAEAVVPAPGAVSVASRGDHKHPRLTSTTINTIGSNNKASVMFTRTFSTMPGVLCILIEAASNQPVIFKVESWLGPGGAAWVSGDYYGAVISAARLNTLPASIALLSVLVSFSISSGSANGAQFSCVAIQQST